MMRPPRGVCTFMMRMASCVQRNAPFRFVSTTDFHCANDRSSIGIGGVPIPALLNRRSSRPNRCFVVAKSARTDSGSLTSAGIARQRDAAAPAHVTAPSRSSARRPANTTLYPSSTNASATALPMPLPAPVTMAILPGPPPALLSIIYGEHDSRLAVCADIPSTHPARIERHHQVAVRIEADHATLAANRLQLLLDDRIGGRLDRHVPVLHPRADIMRDGIANPELADAGRGDRAALVVGVRARA